MAMTDVQELMKRMRNPHWSDRGDSLCKEAADALQQQAAEIDRLTNNFKVNLNALHKAANQRDALQAKLDEAEKQDPVGVAKQKAGYPKGTFFVLWSKLIKPGDQLYTRPIPAQDANVGLVEALKKAIATLERDGDEWQICQYLRTAISQSQSKAAPARVGTEWQPIETAPKDGSTVLTFRLFNGAPQIADAKWFSDAGEWGQRSWRYPSEGGPTHWMPLPATPQPQEGGM